MINKILFKFLIVIFMLCGGKFTFAQQPKVFLLDAKLLQERRQKILSKKSPDKTFDAAIARLEQRAQKFLTEKIVPVTSKEIAPPSGDKHDYMSQAPYFWRDPKTPNGLPYIRRDGERNPEIEKIPDHQSLDKLIEVVNTLALTFYFTDKEIYAAKAEEILRVWFLAEATKMNPHLEYAQAIPGVNTGRGIGIIETRNLPRVVDAIGLLQFSKSWTKADQSGMENWFSKYLDWLLTSKNGRDEAAAKNNHGTFYDVQIASFALFVGRNDLAKSTLETVKSKRIAIQIEPDGSQPLELERTKSWHYSVMNLDGLILLKILGEKSGVDLWNFQTSDRRSIGKAVEFLSDYASGKKSWTYKQIEPFDPKILYNPLRRLGNDLKSEDVKKISDFIPQAKVDDLDFLLFRN